MKRTIGPVALLVLSLLAGAPCALAGKVHGSLSAISEGTKSVTKAVQVAPKQTPAATKTH